jgi:putative transposase
VAPGGLAGAEETATAAGGGNLSATLPPTAINHVRAYDFVFDTCADGRTLKCLTVIDEFTRECLAIDVAGGIRSSRVIDVVAQLVNVHGAPRYLRSDNGLRVPSSSPVPSCVGYRRRKLKRRSLIRAKPWQNGADESFNGKFGDQHLRCNGFGIAQTRGSASKRGAGTTMRSGRIRVSAT